jgi:hypothetical protein
MFCGFSNGAVFSVLLCAFLVQDIRGFLWLTQAKSVEKRGKEKSF